MENMHLPNKGILIRTTKTIPSIGAFWKPKILKKNTQSKHIQMFSLKATVQTKNNEILLLFWPLCPKLKVSVFQSNKQLRIKIPFWQQIKY